MLPPPPPAGPLNAPLFHTASGLRDALLRSYPDAVNVKAPVVMFIDGREWDAYPGWRWIGELLRKRSDWWPALGIAIQHAVTDGDDFARMALADFTRVMAWHAQAQATTPPVIDLPALFGSPS